MEERGRGVFLSAGEPSGDLHGAALAAELRRRDPSLRLYGLGGARMAAAGVRLLAGLDRLAVMGISEVARRLPYFLRLRSRVRRFLARQGIDLFVPIDYPDFNLPMARFARKRGIAVLYYIAPQVWAWREPRARRLAEACDLVCAVLPFEPQLLARHGAEVRFVGHPLLDRAPRDVRPAPRDDGRPVLALFPGSRPHEVERMLPAFAAAAHRIAALRPEVETLVARAPAVPQRLYAPAPGPLVAAEEAWLRATAALAKSGTVTLQLALAGVPMVVGYRMSPLSYRIARRLVRVDHIALVNLVAERRLVPELVQDAMTPEALAEGVLPLLDPEASERRTAVTGLAEVRARLGRPGCASRVAEYGLRLLRDRR